MVEDILLGDQLTPAMIGFGKMLLAALDKQGLAVKGACWLLLSEQRIWRLVIATPEVRTAGPKAVYRKIQTAIARMPADVATIGIGDISVIDEKSELFLSMRSAVSVGHAITNIRIANGMIDGQMITNAYIYQLV